MEEGPDDQAGTTATETETTTKTMTYQQVVNRLLAIMSSHFLINEVGYGNLSDIHTPDDEESPDYPYAFLNPISVNVGEYSFSSQFNLILMDQVTDGDTTAAEDIKVQSNCLMYLQDIMSHFRQTKLRS